MSKAIAFFGATGGSTLACLASALEAGYDCSALSRSSSKLQNLLLGRKIPQSTLDAHLTITEGDIRNPQSVTQTLNTPPKANDGGHNAKLSADIVISGIGGHPNFSPNPLSPTFDDPTICHDGIQTILSALRVQPVSSSKPLLVALSTTGISSQARDIPLLMMPLYRWLLAIPHHDKKAMESLLQAEMAKPVGERVIRDFVAVRPSLLTDGARLGTRNVRVGEEVGKVVKPAVGYTISREDVGGWVFEEMVKGDGGERYAGKMVSITY